MVSRMLSTATPHFRTINFSLIIPYYAENYNPFCRIKSTEFGSAEIMDNPSTWDELYDKTKAARRRHWNFIGRKQGDNIEIFCTASTARLTCPFNEKPGRRHRRVLVPCGWHPPGSLGPAPRCGWQCPPKTRIWGRRTGPAFHTTLPQTKAPLGAVHNATTQQGLAWYCDYQLIDRLSWLLKQLF